MYFQDSKNLLKILIIDDNHELAQNLNDILREKNYDATVASDGKSAIELCSINEFDLALVKVKIDNVRRL